MRIREPKRITFARNKIKVCVESFKQAQGACSRPYMSLFKLYTSGISEIFEVLVSHKINIFFNKTSKEGVIDIKFRKTLLVSE